VKPVFLRREPAFAWASRYRKVVAYVDQAATQAIREWSAFDKRRPRPPIKNIQIPVGTTGASLEHWLVKWLADLSTQGESNGTP